MPILPSESELAVVKKGKEIRNKYPHLTFLKGTTSELVVDQYIALCLQKPDWEKKKLRSFPLDEFNARKIKNAMPS